jgi:DNA-binding NtrC family response regulator
MEKHKSILLVDDDKDICTSLTKVFEKSGYAVFTAHDGREALDFLDKNTVDIIISDLRMPNMDGMEFMKEIRRRKIEIPVIYLTAYGEVESYMDLMNMGAFEYLNKPVDADKILEVAGKILKTAPRSPP